MDKRRTGLNQKTLTHTIDAAVAAGTLVQMALFDMVQAPGRIVQIL
jgi:hypothetical protein